MKLTVTICHDSFEFDGDVDLYSVVPIIRDWMAALPHVFTQQDALREITARLAESTDGLALAVTAQTGAAIIPLTSPRKRDDDMAVPQVLTDLDAEVTRATSVSAGAATLLRGINARLEKAVAEAIANGASADDLAPVTAEVAALKAASDDLSAAIAENTPAATEPPATDTPAA